MTTMEDNGKKTCDLCRKTTSEKGDDIIYFGEWMTRSDVTVHYYCLLLSTNLPQRGKDHSGILGFLLRDIRKEATLALARKCIYCSDTSATIMCNVCKGYFHLICGFTSYALNQFCDQFVSYCDKCIPNDNFLEKFIKEPPKQGVHQCYICLQTMGYFERTKWIYGKCCGNYFAHSKCIKIAALNAGYYFKCIWCKSPRFRDDVKYFGIFVPDREANWELENGAYRDLHRGHKRCDVEKCNCPKGREFNGKKWSIINCKLCGSFGVHNPACIPGMENEKEKVIDFKCDTCSVTELTICIMPSIEVPDDNDDSLEGINTTLFVQKDVKSDIDFDCTDGDESISSVITVIAPELHQQSRRALSVNTTTDKTHQSIEQIAPIHIPCLTQSQETNCNVDQRNEMMDVDDDSKNDVVATGDSESHLHTSDLDNALVDRLAKRLLDLFEI